MKIISLRKFEPNRNTLILICSILFYLIPIALQTGPFLSDLFLSLICIMFLYISIKEKDYKYYKNYFFYFILIFNFYLIVNSIFSNNIFLSFESSFFYIRFGIFSLATWFLIENNKFFLKTFFKVLMLTIIVSLIDGYFQFIYGSSLFGFDGRGARLTLMFNDKMILGGYLVRIFPLLLSLYFLIHKNNKKLMYFFIFLFISIDLLIYITGERSAFGLQILFISLILVSLSSHKLIRFLTLMVSIFFIFIITLSNDSIKERNINHTLEQMNINDSDFSSEIDFSSENRKINIFSEHHETMYRGGIKMFLDNKLFGVGPKLFRVECSNPQYNVGWRTCSTHPHNTYIQIASETGIVGLIFIILIIIYVLHKLCLHFYAKIYKTNTPLNDYQVCLIASFILTLWPIIPSLNFFGNWINILYYMPVGFYLHSIYENNLGN